MFDVTGKNPLLDIALELERIALEDDYFISRKLYPNVDFYSGLIYQAMGFPVTMFPVLFAIPRTSGWIAQWEEMLLDPDQKITRPRQIYIGCQAAGLRAAQQTRLIPCDGATCGGAIVRPTVRRCDGPLRSPRLRCCTIACGADAQNPRTVAPSDAPSQPRTVAPIAPLEVRFVEGAGLTSSDRSQFGPRPAGSAALAECRSYIESQLKASGHRRFANSRSMR